MSLDAFKTASKRAIQKTAKIANKITKVLKIHNKIIQRQLQIKMTKKFLNKYLRKDIYLQKKDKN